MQNTSRPQRSLLPAILSAVLLCAAAAVQAGEPAGQIKRLQGEVTIVRNQQVIVARPGLEVEAKDRLRTGKDGSVGLTTTDNSLLSLGPNSQLVIEQYAFNQQTQDGNIAVRFLKGSFAVISGLLAKAQPAKTQFNTPTATIGIRGTEFVVKIELPAELEAEVLGAEGALK